MKYQENLITGELKKIVEIGDIFYFNNTGRYGVVSAKLSENSGIYAIKSDNELFTIGRTALLRDAEFVGVTDHIEFGTEEQ